MAHRPEDLRSSAFRPLSFGAILPFVDPPAISQEGTENQTETHSGSFPEARARPLTSTDGLNPTLDRWMLLHDRRNGEPTV